MDDHLASVGCGPRPPFRSVLRVCLTVGVAGALLVGCGEGAEPRVSASSSAGIGDDSTVDTPNDGSTASTQANEPEPTNSGSREEAWETAIAALEGQEIIWFSGYLGPTHFAINLVPCAPGFEFEPPREVAFFEGQWVKNGRSWSVEEQGERFVNEAGWDCSQAEDVLAGAKVEHIDTVRHAGLAAMAAQENLAAKVREESLLLLKTEAQFDIRTASFSLAYPVVTMEAGECVVVSHRVVVPWTSSREINWSEEGPSLDEALREAEANVTGGVPDPGLIATLLSPGGAYESASGRCEASPEHNYFYQSDSR